MKSLFLPASWTPEVLAWSFLLLLPFGRSSELPVFIMAILGGVLIWKHGKQAVWQFDSTDMLVRNVRNVRKRMLIRQSGWHRHGLCSPVDA